MNAVSSSPVRIAYVAGCAPGDLRRWSGTTHYLGQALAAHGGAIRHLGPFAEPCWWWQHFKFHFYRVLRRQQYLAACDPRRARALGRQVARALAREPADLVFGTFGDLLVHTPTPLPMVVWTDGTFRRMLDFYPDYQNLCAESRRNGLALDEALLRRCRLVLFSSEWAAQSARDEYGLDPARVEVVPFGANIDCTRTRADVDALIARRQGGPCRLLFIGRIWQRKGGAVALEAARRLNESGVPTELTLVGSGPEDAASLPPWVHALGFVSKAEPAGRRRLDELLAESHFLIVPSRAEAYGIVFCEAASFGLPSLATNVGGIPSIIADGVTGRTFPLQAGGEAYAKFIQSMMRDPQAYQAMARAAFAAYETRLNWNAAGKRVMDLLRQIAADPRPAQ